MKRKLLIIAALTTVFMVGCGKSSKSSSSSDWALDDSLSSSDSSSSDYSSSSSYSDSSSSYESNIEITDERLEYDTPNFSKYYATVTNNNNESVNVNFSVYCYDSNGVKLGDRSIYETIPANTSAYVDCAIEANINDISTYEVVDLKVSGDTSSDYSSSYSDSSSLYESNIEITDERLEYDTPNFSKYYATVTNNNNESLNVSFSVYCYDSNGVKLGDRSIYETIPANTSAYVDCAIEANINDISTYEIVGLKAR